MSGSEWAAVLGAVATVLSSVASLVVAIRTGQKTSATHDLVNGQSAVVQALAEAKGNAEGRAEGIPGVMGKNPQSEIGSSTH